ncbi:MAG: alpha/beta hydrolase [Candidatus Omnitrophota bacterium]|jgi:fermentation-respiration switch protein FrsA (DUF1100 family)|nr:MAG: alpha/beta hydrolase [Candidatus Omnitrophota bacterium]
MFYKILVIILAVFCLVFVYVKYVEYKGIFYPSKDILAYPSSSGIPFEDIMITTEDNLKINGWFLQNPKAKYTLLFLHGNAGNIGDRIDKIGMLYELGLNILIIDYRGFGKSEGKPSESGLYKDASASYHFLVNKRNIAADEVILYGESLGTAVAVDLASKNKVKALILEGAFSSGKDMAKEIYPFLPRIIFSNSYNSLAKVRGAKMPKLFIHSREDEIVPYRLAQKLYGVSSFPKKIVSINGPHNESFLISFPEYKKAIKEFIDKL